MTDFGENFVNVSGVGLTHLIIQKYIFTPLLASVKITAALLACGWLPGRCHAGFLSGVWCFMGLSGWRF